MIRRETRFRAVGLCLAFVLLIAPAAAHALPSGCALGVVCAQFLPGASSDVFPPVVNAGLDRIVVRESVDGTEVTLEGSATDDYDPNPHLAWYEGEILLGTGTTVVQLFGEGRHTVTLKAIDHSGHIGEDEAEVTVTGFLIFEGPEDRGEGAIAPVPEGYDKCSVTVNIYAQGFFDFFAVQTKPMFINSGPGAGDFQLEAVEYNEERFPLRLDAGSLSQQIVGFALLGGAVDLAEKTRLFSLTYTYTGDCSLGEYAIEPDLGQTIVHNSALEFLSFDVTAGSLTVDDTWPTPGDANLDGTVNILDIITVRNCLNKDTGSGDCWKADVTQDGAVNVLDMMFVRNHLNEECDCE